jgi:hypothetical protein
MSQKMNEKIVRGFLPNVKTIYDLSSILWLRQHNAKAESELHKIAIKAREDVTNFCKKIITTIESAFEDKKIPNHDLENIDLKDLKESLIGTVDAQEILIFDLIEKRSAQLIQALEVIQVISHNEGLKDEDIAIIEKDISSFKPFLYEG